MHFSELDTPALLISLNRLEGNIARMSDLARRHNVALRPHTKTHKCPEIVKLQIENGASGITCAKLGEAEVMADAGISDILIANQIIGETKLKRLMGLARRTRTSIAVDSEFGAVSLNTALGQAGLAMDVLIEINCGQNRCGLSPGEEVLQLAMKIIQLEHVNLRGLMTHGGHVYAQSTQADIEKVGLHEGRAMVETAELLRSNGIEIETVSVGSTPTSSYCAAVKGITEIRPGTYIFNDLIMVDLFAAAIKNCALSVLATVTSRPAKNRAILDAGKKTLTADTGHGSCSSRYGLIPAKNTLVSRLSEEHGIIESDTDFEIGEKVKIIPNHACVVVNMFDEMYGLRNGEVETTFKITGRGRVT